MTTLEDLQQAAATHIVSVNQAGNGESGQSLVSVENASPEVIHVVNVSGTSATAGTPQVVAITPSQAGNYQTISLSGGIALPVNTIVSLNFSKGD